MDFVANFYAFQQCKNFENRLSFNKVTESLKVGSFLRHSVDFLTMGVSGGSRPSQSCKCAIVDLRTAFYTLSMRKRKFLQKYCLLDNTVCALCRQQADIELASLN